MPKPKDQDPREQVVEEDELLQVLEAEQPALVAGGSALSAQSGKSSKTDKSERNVEKAEELVNTTMENSVATNQMQTTADQEHDQQ